jgi:hypothetical protein
MIMKSRFKWFWATRSGKKKRCTFKKRRKKKKKKKISKTALSSTRRLTPIINQSISPIRGFDKGLEGICAGERRVVTIPPAWGYGAKGYATIPGDSTLLFEVEALRVTTPPPLSNDATFKEAPSSWSDWIVALLVVGVPVAGAYWGATRPNKKAKKVATPKSIKKLAAEIAKKK